jgi:hypothetical protein
MTGRSGETGRRTGLKIRRRQLHVGSIPTSGTIEYNTLLLTAVFKKKAFNALNVEGLFIHKQRDYFIQGPPTGSLILDSAYTVAAMRYKAEKAHTRRI